MSGNSEREIALRKSPGGGLIIKPANGGVPPEVIADRDRRRGIERSAIEELLGDPLPGYSALDRLRTTAVPK